MNPVAFHEIEMLAEGCKKEILGDPGVYLARKQAEQEETDRWWNARQAAVRKNRRLRPVRETS
jgi:hypothetical protein